MSVVQLITAVQSSDLEQVKHVVQTIKANTKDRFSFLQAINEGLKDNGITALHVACKMFALSPWHPAHERIISYLLEQGVHPYTLAFFGNSRREQDGLTPIMCCDGKLPQALKDYLSTRQPKSKQASGECIPYGWALAGINMEGFTEINYVLEREKVYAERRKNKKAKAAA